MIGPVSSLLVLGMALTPLSGGAALIDPRVQVTPYAVEQVVPLSVPTNYQTTILLAPGEQVQSVAVGNSDAWQVIASQRGDAVFVKPIQADNRTNMTVISDSRVYSFELVSTSAPDNETAYVLRFSYPPSAAEAGRPTPQPGVGRYRVRGARAPRPSALSDDGVQTSIQWPQDRAIPAVFALDDQAHEVLLQGQIRDGSYVIDGVHRTLVFRLGGEAARATRERVEARP